MFPNLKLIRWAPLCPMHWKTHLDRRFSSITRWQNTYQLKAKITSIEHMQAVLTAGKRGSNKKRMEVGDQPIPTTFTIFKLQPPGASIPYVQIERITSLLAVTYIPKLDDRLMPTHTGYYINAFPWIPWQKGKPIPEDQICDGPKAEVLTAKQRKLRAEHKPAEFLQKEDYTALSIDHVHRCKLIESMGVNVKEVHNPSF